MPQFEFYINDKEREDVISYILLKNTNIVIDKLYLFKEVEMIKTLNDFSENLKKEHVRYFLIHDSFANEKLEFLDIDFDEITKYKISQRVGGPYIDLVFYLGYSSGSTIKYKSSIIDYYAKFINPNSHVEYKAPEEIKTYYKELVAFVKTMCSPIKKNNKTYWISKKIINEMKYE